jgi:hypothetical protein
MNLANALNTVWMWNCCGESRAFRRASKAVAQTQAALLKEIISRNRNTAYGVRHGFSTIRTPREFQQRVPLSNYDTYAELIRRIAAGEPNVLTREPVQLLEPTSGTTRGEKLIPYTRSLRRQFQRAIAAWIADLMQHRPAVRRGRAYWSISPAFGQARRTAGGIPVGFDDDTAYLGRLERLAMRRLLVVPPAIAKMTNMENFRYCTLWHLLQAEDMSLISVWSPTYLSTLLEPLEEWTDPICFDLRHGSLSLPTPVNSDLRRELNSRVRANSRRAHQLESILRSNLSMPEKLRQVWPKLALISCWTDAAAAGYVAEVRRFFPSVEIQPKGLLATEGCVSFPLVGHTGSALALRSHFFEFAEADDPRGDPENCRLAHELSQGTKYRVIITTAGGLYRYQLNDVVQVVGFENQCPLLRFLGRSDCVSDMVGEKLSEPHVREVLNRAFAAHGITPRFSLLVPAEGRPPRYRLYLQGSELSGMPELPSSMARAVQAGLEKNPYYRHAIQLCQLSPVEVCILDASSKPGWLIYERQCLARAMKAGDIKPTALAQREIADARSLFPPSRVPGSSLIQTFTDCLKK